MNELASASMARETFPATAEAQGLNAPAAERQASAGTVDRFPRQALAMVVVIHSLVSGAGWLIGRGYFSDPREQQIFSNVMLAVWLAGNAGGIAVVLILVRALKRGTAAVTAFSEGIHRGRLRTRLDVAQCGPLSDAAVALNAMAAGLQQHISDVDTELSGLKAILSAMEEGLVVVDSSKRILMANPAARKMIGLPDGELIGRPIQELNKQPELLGNIELALSARQTCSFEFQTMQPSGREGANARRFMLARCTPFHNDAPAAGDVSRLNGAVAVLHDITELRRLERMRTEFVANVSHELRTPLTSLLGYLETLHDGGWLDHDQAQRFLLVCRRQAERLSRIVEDLLRLSRLENPQQEIAGSEIDLSEVVNSAVDQCHSLAEDRRIALELQLPPTEARIWGDRGLLVQALTNLIENGINYNREKGKVSVRLQRSPSDQQWELTVEDTGIGIPPEAMGRIFERFYRVDKARSREGGGTGLGLSIVRHIALAHGASVHVESELDKGSTFFLRFKARERQDHALSASK